MKKITVFLIILVLPLLTSCNNDINPANEKFLEEFDYLTQLMEDTFPYFGVPERRLGIDIRELATEARTIIKNYPYSMEEFARELGIALEDIPEMDEHVFWSIISHEFFNHFSPFAHTRVHRFDIHNILNPLTYYEDIHLSEVNYLAFNNTITQDFYEDQERLFEQLPREQSSLFYFIFRRNPYDVDMTTPLTRPVVEITTEILEENHIAYVSISSFFGTDWLHYNDILREFYREIQNYDHLIIDIRENDGGSSIIWRSMIMHELWLDRSNMPNMPLYALYKGSELGRSLAEAHIETLHAVGGFADYVPETNLLSIDEILESSSLPEVNKLDLQDLAYGVRFDTSLVNYARQLASFGAGRQTHPFAGNIWLLTSERNTSASALFARHAKYMDFATLVGEPTGGLYTAGPRMLSSLPITGIVVSWDVDYLVDQYGRALEEFTTTPHHFNRPGLDALETVLMLIVEGDY